MIVKTLKAEYTEVSFLESTMDFQPGFFTKLCTVIKNQVKVFRNYQALQQHLSFQPVGQAGEAVAPWKGFCCTKLT